MFKRQFIVHCSFLVVLVIFIMFKRLSNKFLINVVLSPAWKPTPTRTEEGTHTDGRRVEETRPGRINRHDFFVMSVGGNRKIRVSNSEKNQPIFETLNRGSDSILHFI
jgi:hypothetical protein